MAYGLATVSCRSVARHASPAQPRRLQGSTPHRPALLPPPRAVETSSSLATARQLQPFELERFFAQYEFCTRHLLCCSDCEPLGLTQLLSIADKNSLARWEALSLGYTESNGLPALREEVAGMYESVSPDEVIVGAPEELIYLSMRAMLKPGDTVVVSYPGYQSLYEVAQSIGCNVRFWEPITNSDGHLEFRVSGTEEGCLEALIRQSSPKLVVTNFPHNPTGKLLPHDEWAKVSQLCDQCGAALFSDEMYRMLEPDPTTRLVSAVDAFQDGGITLSGVSKTLGLPGLRIGWLVSHDAEFRKRVLELKDYTTICSSAPSEVLALMGLRAKDAIVALNLEFVAETTARLAPLFEQHSDILAWDPPTAGSTAFPRFRGDTPDVDTMCKLLVERHGVLLLPGSVYGCDRLTREKRFRLGLGRTHQEEGIREFAAFLEERPWKE